MPWSWTVCRVVAASCRCRSRARPVERQPLRGRQHAAGDAHAQHEGERLLQLLARALGAQVAVVLQIHAVEFDQLLIVLDDRAGDSSRSPSANVPRR